MVAIFAAFGILAALVERQRSGRGQVVDAAMVDGSGYLLAPFFELFHAGVWTADRSTTCSTAGHRSTTCMAPPTAGAISIGTLEPQFFAELCRVLGVAGEPAFSEQYREGDVAGMRARIAEVVGRKPLDEWVAAFDGVDSVVAPVLRIDEVHEHPHQLRRQERTRVRVPAARSSPPVAPRLSTYARRAEHQVRLRPMPSS